MITNPLTSSFYTVLNTNQHFSNLCMRVVSIHFSNPFRASPSLLTTDDVYQDNVNPFSPDLITANPFLARTPLQPQQQMLGGDGGNKGFSFNSEKPSTPLNDVTNVSSSFNQKQQHTRQSAGNNNGEVRRRSRVYREPKYLGLFTFINF